MEISANLFGANCNCMKMVGIMSVNNIELNKLKELFNNN